MRCSTGYLAGEDSGQPNEFTSFGDFRFRSKAEQTAVCREKFESGSYLSHLKGQGIPPSKAIAGQCDSQFRRHICPDATANVSLPGGSAAQSNFYPPCQSKKSQVTPAHVRSPPSLRFRLALTHPGISSLRIAFARLAVRPDGGSLRVDEEPPCLVEILATCLKWPLKLEKVELPGFRDVQQFLGSFTVKP